MVEVSSTVRGRIRTGITDAANETFPAAATAFRDNC